MTLLPQTVEWDREQEREAAAVLLGGEVQEQAWSDEIYRYYNETGSIQFHRDGTFQGEFVEGAFQLEGAGRRRVQPPGSGDPGHPGGRASPFRLTAGRRTL